MSLLPKLKAFVRKLEAGSPAVRNVANFYRKRKTLAQRPIIFQGGFGIHNIELTNRCPMRCVMCPRTESMTRDQGFMEFTLFKSIIDQMKTECAEYLKDHVLWLHHFGESLLHPEFEKFINYAADQGMRLGISINPLMVKGPIADRLLASNLDTIVASIDGHDDASFESIRGVKNAYEASKQNMLSLLQRKIATNWRAKIIISMIDFKLNEESIKETKEFWLSQPGVDEFQQKAFVTFNGDDEGILKLCDGGNQDAGLPFVICDWPWTMMSIAWDGDVVPCCYDYDKKYVLGNLKKDSLRDIWNGPAMHALRREFNSNKVCNSLCRDCPSLYGTAAS